MADFSLRLRAPYTLPANKTILLDELPGVVESWEREENRWGYFQGVFSVEGNVALPQLIDWHGQWLGSEVVEIVGSTAVFEGYAHELRLYHGDVCRVHGYDVGGGLERRSPGMYNAVRGAIGQMVENAEFELDGAAPPVFENWQQTIGGGDSITQETTDPIKLGQSPKLTNGGSGNTYLYQDIPVQPNTTYRVSFTSCGNGSVAGRYRLYDVSNAADIVPLVSTGNVGLGQFRGVSEEITTPAGCTGLRLYLYAPSAAGWAVFDSVEVTPIVDGDKGQAYTDWLLQAQSITAHGRREITLDARKMTPLEAKSLTTSFLAARGWPQETQENGDGSTRLDVHVSGYIHRADWLMTDDDLHGQTAGMSDLITAIAAKLPWVTSTAVRVNATPYTMPEQPQTLLDALRDITLAGDVGGAMWRLYIDRGRRLIYEPVDFQPALSMTGGKIYRRLGDRQTVNPRIIRAMSVVRDYDFPGRNALPGSLLPQRNDSLLESIVVGPRGLRRSVAGV